MLGKKQRYCWSTSSQVKNAGCWLSRPSGRCRFYAGLTGSNNLPCLKALLRGWTSSQRTYNCLCEIFLFYRLLDTWLLSLKGVKLKFISIKISLNKYIFPSLYYITNFYPRDAMLARYLLSSCVRPFVCLSVCLSVASFHCTYQNGETKSPRQRQSVVDYNPRFLTNISLYLRNGARYNEISVKNRGSRMCSID